MRETRGEWINAHVCPSSKGHRLRDTNMKISIMTFDECFTVQLYPLVLTFDSTLGYRLSTPLQAASPSSQARFFELTLSLALTASMVCHGGYYKVNPSTMWDLSSCISKQRFPIFPHIHLDVAFMS